LKQYCFFVDLCNFEYEGILVKSVEKEMKKHLSTIRHMSVKKAGSKIEITRDMMTSPGYILISHPSRKVLLEEYSLLRQLEKNDLYMVREESSASCNEAAESTCLSSSPNLDSEEYDSEGSQEEEETGVTTAVMMSGEKRNSKHTDSCFALDRPCSLTVE
jgi:hypothetical protein